MQEAQARFSPESSPPPGSWFRKPLTIIAGALVFILAVYLVFFHSPSPSSNSAGARLPFGAEEQAYAAKLQFSNLAMSQAENFLNQEVKILSGDVVNSGDQTLRRVEVTVVFVDDMQQIALRESRPLLAANAPSLDPGKTAHFEISFDHVPPSWNVQMPTVRVSGVEFSRSKQ